MGPCSSCRCAGPATGIITGDDPLWGRSRSLVCVDWLIFGGVVMVGAALGLVAQRKGWIDMSGKNVSGRGGAGAGLAGSLDEVFAPTRHEAQQERDRQTSMPAPAPVAGDGDKDIFSGKVRIDLSDR
jgi:hypothetical protein